MAFGLLSNVKRDNCLCNYPFNCLQTFLIKIHWCPVKI